MLTATALNSVCFAAQEAEWGEDSSARSGTAVSSSDELQGLGAPRGGRAEPRRVRLLMPGQLGCAAARSASLPAQLGWQPRAGKGARGGSFDLHRVRAPALLPCMRVSLEIEPLDLTPRSVLDFSALASPHAVRACACTYLGVKAGGVFGKDARRFLWQHRAGLHDSCGNLVSLGAEAAASNSVMCL